MENSKIEEQTFLPDHYIPVNEPFFEGRGNHSVMKLEELCEQYKEFTHHLQIKFQTAALQSSSNKKEVERLQRENEELKSLMRSIDDELSYMEDYAHGHESKTITSMRGKINKALNPSQP